MEVKRGNFDATEPCSLVTRMICVRVMKLSLPTGVRLHIDPSQGNIDKSHMHWAVYVDGPVAIFITL